MPKLMLALISSMFLFSQHVKAGEKTYFDTFTYGCDQKEQPSSIRYLKQFSPHMLVHAVDIDFVVKQTGVCTSLLITLMEQETGIIRRHTLKRKPWIRPFGDLSAKYGFIAQLVDVSVKLRALKNRSYSGYLPADESMAYLFNVKIPASQRIQLSKAKQRADFDTLYRDMFMLEYRPMHMFHSSDFGLQQDLLLRGWQFRPNLV